MTYLTIYILFGLFVFLPYRTALLYKMDNEKEYAYVSLIYILLWPFWYFDN